MESDYMVRSEEKVSPLDAEKLVVTAELRDDGQLLVHVIVRLVGERHAYQTRYKVSREFLNPDSDTMDLFFEEAKKVLRETLEGKRELNAII